MILLRRLHRTSRPNIPLRGKRKSGSDEETASDSDEDLGRKRLLSKDRAISALSQPNAPTQTPNTNNDSTNKQSTSKAASLLPSKKVKSDRQEDERTRIKKNNAPKASTVPLQSRSSDRRWKNSKRSREITPKVPNTAKAAYSSLLPPPLSGSNGSDDDSLSTGLSSWEEFLGKGEESSGSRTTPIVGRSQEKRSPSRVEARKREKSKEEQADESDNTDKHRNLPSILDLFPSALSTNPNERSASSSKVLSEDAGKSYTSLDGVLPVSDLFYRSSIPQAQRIDGSEQATNATDDGEESPYRRAVSQTPGKQEMAKKPSSTKKRSGRKMVRRGMEMLVGGVPINADPPQRNVDLCYDRLAADWATSISLNTREFGPLLHGASIPKVSLKERGLFCEYFCHAAMKWDVCPTDLQSIIDSHSKQISGFEVSAWKKTSAHLPGGKDLDKLAESISKDILSRLHEDSDTSDSMITKDTRHDGKSSGDGIPRIAAKLDLHAKDSRKQRSRRSKSKAYAQSKAKGFGKDKNGARRSKKELVDTDALALYSNEFKIMAQPIGISKSDLESGGQGTQVFESVLRKAFETHPVLIEAIGEFHVDIYNCTIEGTGPESSLYSVEFGVFPKKVIHQSEKPELLHKMIEALRFILDTDDSEDTLNSTLARIASEEYRWSPSIRERVALQFNDQNAPNQRLLYTVNAGVLEFEIGVSRAELESGGDGGEIFQSVLEKAIGGAMRNSLAGFHFSITHFTLDDHDDGTSLVSADVQMETSEPIARSENRLIEKNLRAALAQAFENGSIILNLAAEAKKEERWPKEVRDRVVEECLFEDDDGDEPVSGLGPASYPFGATRVLLTEDNDEIGDTFEVDKNDYSQNDLFLGGGNDGVFFDYSEENAFRAPFRGQLGLRLVDAVTERAKQRQPRVIAIGDVHGCIDELQDLLRQCDYRPGDLVVFLGDLVCKGPDSISVVQMAREIGAFGVRGNHDFEVIRWHQAIKSGVDPPVVGSEHFHIASCLSKADMKWMNSLPWYLSSKELGSLFVHAGFVSGIRLAKQNPRLMMNMRSILPDGTVTSKFFNNWPWARLWDGPQTVLFGHDADRGLQQYEHAIGLDTGCVYGGRLTACILPEKRLVSVSAKREYFKYRRKHYD